MKQVVAIHGGGSFNDREMYLEKLRTKPVTIDDFKPKADWKRNLQDALGPNYEVLLPRMPNSADARYDEWTIWFERMIPFITDGVILVGHSLGGIFIAKYLAENNFPRAVRASLLIAAPFNTTERHPTANFNLALPITEFARQGGEIHLFHSKDDRVVDFVEMGEYHEGLPSASIHEFTDRGHFNGPEFPELVEIIKSL